LNEIGRGFALGHELVEKAKGGGRKIDLLALLAHFSREAFHKQQGVAPAVEMLNFLRGNFSVAEVTLLHLIIPPGVFASRSIGMYLGDRA
jgi:hypothetical protein